MSGVSIHPSRVAYEASWPERKRQALGIGGGAVVVFLAIVAVGVARQPSTALLILLLLGLAGRGLVGRGCHRRARDRNGRSHNGHVDGCHRQAGWRRMVSSAA